MIRLTSTDVIRINPPLLAEELESALGYRVQIGARHKDGLLLEAQISRVDGLPFSPEEQANIRAIVAMHDPSQLSTGQLAEMEAQADYAEALDALSEADLDALRQAIREAGDLTSLKGAALALAELIAHLRALIPGPYGGREHA